MTKTKCEDTYMSTKNAKRILGVHVQTLYNWEKSGKLETIRTAGGHRLYNVEKYLKLYGSKNDNYEKSLTVPTTSTSTTDDKLNICYVRVSTLSQKDGLERQTKYMTDRYPTYVVIKDIGSGMNFNRRGFRTIIKYAIEGKINKVVVAYKDRFTQSTTCSLHSPREPKANKSPTRFGFEFIEDLIKDYSNGQIIIEDEKETKKQPKEELVEDVLQILNVYTAKMNGLRKYKKNTI
jgi:putative resolvase